MSAPETASPAHVDRPSPTLRRVAMALSLLGLAVAAYLTYVHYTGTTSVCAITHGCEQVQHSEWSKLAGMPVALLGLAGYAAILTALALDGEQGRLAALAMTWLGFAFSAYLTYRELFSIDAICIWCVTSAIVLTLLTPLTTARFLFAPD